MLHWNILYQKSAENILSVVKGINPEIFCCQEINDANDNLVQKVAKLFKYHYFEPAEIIGANDEKLRLGNAIFSSYPIDFSRKVVLWNGPNQTSLNKHEARIYVESILDYQGKKLRVGTTHLSFAPYFEVTPDRQQQAIKLLEAIKGNSQMFVLTGDFNSAPNTKIIKDIERYFTSAGPPHDKPTFSIIPFSFLGFEVTGLDWRVDYIFTTKDIKVLSSRIIKAGFSDRLPIVAEIQI